MWIINVLVLKKCLPLTEAKQTYQKPKKATLFGVIVHDFDVLCNVVVSTQGNSTNVDVDVIPKEILGLNEKLWQ